MLLVSLTKRVCITESVERLSELLIVLKLDGNKNGELRDVIDKKR